MSRFAWIACGALVTLVPATATAQLSFPSRISSAAITTTKKDLSDAKATITATTLVRPGSTGSRSLDLYASSSLAGLGTASTGDVGISASIAGQDPDDYGYAEITGSVSATGPLGGSFSLIESYRTDTDPYATGPLYRYADASVYRDPAYGFLPAFTTNAPSLEFFLPIGGAGLVDQGGLFVAELSITGDYSGTAGLNSGTGQHYLAHLNPDWMITSNFLYNPLTDLTTFRAQRASYDYNNEGPLGLELDAFFFGAPAAAGAVPEPATWTAMTIGLLLVGAMLRRWGGARSAGRQAPSTALRIARP